MKKNILFFSLLIVFLFSCKKKWQRTAKTNVEFVLAEPANSDLINIKTGSIFLNRTEFVGERQQSNNVSFTDYPQQTINFTANMGSPLISYDIPQGTYSSISMEFELSKQSFGNNLFFAGVYKSLNPTSGLVPIRFELNEVVLFKSSAFNSNGGNEIVLLEKKTSNVQVILNPSSWFNVVSPNMFDTAYRTDVGGQPTILINDSVNSSIYNIVLNRLGLGTKIVFN